MSRVLAVGDIHTKTWIVNRVEKIADNYDRIVFVGDYADDWGKQPIDTINTWKRLKDFQDAYPKKAKFVIGNHDFAYLLSYYPHSGGFNPLTKLLLNDPENKALKKWLGAIKIKVKIDGVTYSHAGYSESWTPQDGLWNDFSPIWVRPNEAGNYLPKQVFGHTPSETCWEVQPTVWCIDTFSTYRDGTPFGDETVLEIIDGKTFTKIKLEE